jgi:hypothetical protein
MRRRSRPLASRARRQIHGTILIQGLHPAGLQETRRSVLSKVGEPGVFGTLCIMLPSTYEVGPAAQLSLIVCAVLCWRVCAASPVMLSSHRHC